MSESTTERKTMPIQLPRRPIRVSGYVPVSVYMAAYEVYCEVYAPQEALVTGGCRGGFGVGELVAFLYARSFPRDQWRRRVDEAFKSEFG